MKNIIWLSLRPETPARGYWDQYFFELAFKNHNHFYEITDQKEAIVIIPGAYQGDLIDEINNELSKLEKYNVIITSDEENKFPIEKLNRKGRVFATYPTDKMIDVEWLPIGYPPQAELINKINYKFDKYIDWFFAGQVNHESRVDMVNNVRDVPNGELHISGGFAQGLKHDEYYLFLKESKIVLCPRGNISPDSFRLYEALEAGCIPIVENNNFWKGMFKTIPFPIVNYNFSWKEAIKEVLNDYEFYKRNVDIWWKTTKNNILLELRNL